MECEASCERSPGSGAADWMMRITPDGSPDNPLTDGD